MIESGDKQQTTMNNVLNCHKFSSACAKKDSRISCANVLNCHKFSSACAKKIAELVVLIFLGVLIL